MFDLFGNEISGRMPRRRLVAPADPSRRFHISRGPVNVHGGCFVWECYCRCSRVRHSLAPRSTAAINSRFIHERNKSHSHLTYRYATEVYFFTCAMCVCQVVLPDTGADTRLWISDVDQGSLFLRYSGHEQGRYRDAVSQLHGKVGNIPHRAARGDVSVGEPTYTVFKSCLFACLFVSSLCLILWLEQFFFFLEATLNSSKIIRRVRTINDPYWSDVIYCIDCIYLEKKTL